MPKGTSSPANGRGYLNPKEWHYWLWEYDHSGNVDPPIEFPTLKEAREAALALGRPVDILRTPNPKTEMGEYVETVTPPQK